MSATASPDESVLEKMVNVVIIYDDLASATRANVTLERAFRSTDSIPVWNIKPWRADLLNLPVLAAEALKETSDAHLIIFALRPGQARPSQLLEWLEEWARHRQVSEAALAVLDSSGDRPSTPLTPHLPEFAKRHGLNFIFGAGGLTQYQPAVENGPLEDEILTMPAGPEATEERAHQHWGINE